MARQTMSLTETDLADLLHACSETTILERPPNRLIRRLLNAYERAGGDREEYPALLTWIGDREPDSLVFPSGGGLGG